MQKKITLLSAFYILTMLNTDILPARAADDGSAVSAVSSNPQTVAAGLFSQFVAARSFPQPPVVGAVAGALHPANVPHSRLQHHQDPYNPVDSRYFPPAMTPRHLPPFFYSEDHVLPSHHPYMRHLAQQRQHLAQQQLDQPPAYAGYPNHHFHPMDPRCSQPLAHQYPQPFAQLAQQHQRFHQASPSHEKSYFMDLPEEDDLQLEPAPAPLGLGALLKETDKIQQEEYKKKAELTQKSDELAQKIRGELAQTRDELAQKDAENKKLKGAVRARTQTIQAHEKVLADLQIQFRDITHSLALARHEAQELKKELDLKKRRK